MRVPREIVDRIRDRVDISEVVGRHVRLERRGNSYVGLCPFHQEKSPSFNVVPSKGIFHCFGCGQGGDVFKFVMHVEGLSFIEAVKELGRTVGVELPERELTLDERRALAERASLYDVLEAACAFYESTLWTRPEGKAGRDYLAKRQLSDDLARRARVGFAPPGWTPLLDHLARKGVPEARLAEAGLIRPRQSGQGHYDLFRDRVLFPIKDEKGRVIGFGGRLLDGDGPKYVNTPETRLYEKSKVLYALDLARQGIQQRDRVVVVEGYFDVLAMHDAGITETVATCGTALTPEHLRKIKRLTQNVIVLLDADEAGSRAAEKVLPMFLEAGLMPLRLQLPGAKDPDELVRTEGPGAMTRAMEHAEPLLEWVIGRRINRVGSSAIPKMRLLEELAPMLVGWPATIATKVSRELSISESVVREAVARAAQPRERGPDAVPDRETPAPPPRWRPSSDHTHLLWLLIHRYAHTVDLVSRSDEVAHLLDDPRLQRVIARLVAMEPVASVAADADDDVRRVLLAVVAREGLYPEDRARLAMCEVLDRLVGPRRESRVRLLKDAQTQALQQGDFPASQLAATARKTLMDAAKAAAAALASGDVDAWIRAFDATTRGDTLG